MIRAVAIGERWLGPLRPFVLSGLPPAPASVIEIGCGTARRLRP